jgi:hypothetical protein
VSNGPARVAHVAPGTVCFSGSITRASADVLLSILRQIPRSEPLLLVASSSGGDIDSALDVAEELLPRKVTTLSGPICASACANYFFLPADRRIVPAGSIVAFHGGLSKRAVDRFRDLLTDAERRRPLDPAAVARRRLIYENVLVNRPRELAMLRAIGADPTFFDVFDRIYVGPGSQWRRDCRHAAVDPAILVLSPEFLRARGVTVESWRGPRSPDELERHLDALGASKTMCFWR